MKGTWILPWVCVAIGVGITLAQSNPNTNAGTQQGQVSSDAAGQTGNDRGGQAAGAANAQPPQSQPAAPSNAQTQTSQSNGAVRQPSERGAGGVSVVWLLLGIAVVVGILYLVARGGGMDREGQATHIRRADQLDRENMRRENVDRNRAA